MRKLRDILVGKPERTWWYVPIIRLMVGWVFVLAGVQKFIYPDDMGPGRFEEMGLPMPEILAYFVGSVELICGIFVLIGFFTRFASLPLCIVMIFAIGLTKVDVFIAEGAIQGLHDSRLDVSMFLGALYLLFTGSGPWSVDKRLTEN